MSRDDLTELIGCIIDTFEDDLHNRDMSRYGTEPTPNEGIIPLYFEKEDSNGVYYGGDYYDNVAGKLKTLLREFGFQEK